MNVIQFVRQQVAEAREPDRRHGGSHRCTIQLAATGHDPSHQERLPAAPVAGEDLFFQWMLQDQPPLWATSGWAGRIGLAQAPGGGQGWEEANRTVLALAPVLAYAEAVRSATAEYLARLTDDELDRPVSFFGSESSVAGVLARFVAHTAGRTRGRSRQSKGCKGCRACRSEAGSRFEAGSGSLLSRGLFHEG